MKKLYNLFITSYELRVTSYKLRVTRFKRFISYLLPHTSYLFLLSAFCFLPFFATAQVSNVQANFSCPGQVIVTYDLDACKPVDISLWYSQDQCNWAKAETFIQPSDIGTGVSSGVNKSITWNNVADNAVFGKYYFDVRAPYYQCAGVVINCVCWAEYNLTVGGLIPGYMGVPFSYLDNPAYQHQARWSALFQWGRKADGHEVRPTTYTPDTGAPYPDASPRFPCNNNYTLGLVGYGDGEQNYSPIGPSLYDGGLQPDPSKYVTLTGTHCDGPVSAYGKFIKTDMLGDGNWCDQAQNWLWNYQAGTTNPVQKSSSDPCPSGWRVPTVDELTSLNDGTKVTPQVYYYAGMGYGPFPGTQSGYGYSFTDNTTGNVIFLPFTGSVSFTGQIINIASQDYIGTGAYYWSNTSNGTGIYALNLGQNSNNLQHTIDDWIPRGWGCAIRCVADE